MYNSQKVLSIEAIRKSRDKVMNIFKNNLKGWKDITANDFNSMITPILEATFSNTNMKFRFTFESSVPVKTAELVEYLFQICPTCKFERCDHCV